MRTYIRSHSKSGVYFFTVNLAQRKQNDLLVRHVDDLRQAFRYTKQRYPLVIEAIVVLPEHLHSTCMDAGGRATQGAVAEYLAITRRRRRLSVALAFDQIAFFPVYRER